MEMSVAFSPEIIPILGLFKVVLEHSKDAPGLRICCITPCFYK